jgi:hypothetical protein
VTPVHASPSLPAASDPAAPALQRLGAWLAVASATLLWLAARDLPFFSDDWQHLANTRAFAGWWTAFDPALEPFRPLQHLYFWLLNTAGIESPAVARAPLYAMHALAAVLLQRVVLHASASPRAAFASLCVFLVLPSAKVLSWPAAIGWPGRLVALLLAVLAVQRHLQKPSQRTAVVTTACTVVALGWHQSGILLPPTLLLATVPSTGWRALPRQLFAPWFVGPCLVAAGVVLLLLFGRERPPPGAEAQAIAANATRATFAFTPQIVRIPVLDALRGGGSGIATGLALAATAFVGAAWLWLATVGAKRWRWLLVAIAFELALPVLSVGFVPRYGYLAGAMLAPVLVAAFADRIGSSGMRPKLWRIGAALLVATFAVDHVRDLLQLHATARTAETLRLEIRSAALALPPGATLTVLDTLYSDGPERDLLVWNFGLAEALRRAGVGDRVALFRRARGWWMSDLPPLDDDGFAALRRSDRPALHYAPERRSYEPLPRDHR